MIRWLIPLVALGLFCWLAWYSWHHAPHPEPAAYSQQAIHRVNELAGVRKHKWTKEDTRQALIDLGWGRE
jgi:hypothetical protein